MATFYRPPFGVPPPLPPPSASMPLDMSQGNASSSKKKTDETENEEIVAQNLLDDSSASSSSPKKKARKSNARSKAKAKKSETDGENGVDDDSPSPPPPPTAAPASKKKKKKMKTDAAENGNTNDSDEAKLTNGNANNHSHNLLAQMGLINNSFMPPGLAPGAAATNGKPGTPNAQQAQLAAMYNMAPHFAAYNAFQGAFNPAFAAAAYASGYPTPYGFHPAFGGPAPGQPFPFMPPGGAPGAPPMNKYDRSFCFAVILPAHRASLSAFQARTIRLHWLQAPKRRPLNRVVRAMQAARRRKRLLDRVRRSQQWISPRRGQRARWEGFPRPPTCSLKRPTRPTQRRRRTNDTTVARKATILTNTLTQRTARADTNPTVRPAMPIALHTRHRSLRRRRKADARQSNHTS